MTNQVTSKAAAAVNSYLDLPQLFYQNVKARFEGTDWWNLHGNTIQISLESLVHMAGYSQNGSALSASIGGDAAFLLDVLPFQQMLAPNVTNFLDLANQLRYNIDLRMHPPSPNKTDLGYSHDEIAITLAYADKEGIIHYFVFTRNSPEKICGKLSRSALRKFVGVKDLKAAADQAKRNLEGIMERGNIGPFYAQGSGKVYVDSSSYEQSHNNPRLKVNFSLGFDMLSLNVRLVHAVHILEKIYRKNIIVTDLWSPQKE